MQAYKTWTYRYVLGSEFKHQNLLSNEIKIDNFANSQNV